MSNVDRGKGLRVKAITRGVWQEYANFDLAVEGLYPERARREDTREEFERHLRGVADHPGEPLMLAGGIMAEAEWL